MSRNKINKPSDKGNNNNVAIMVAIVGLIGTFITAYFGFKASTASTAMIIDATKTAQVSLIPTVEVTSGALLPTLQVTYPSDCMGYERLNDWAQAAECYKQKVIANPDDFRAISDVARVYGNGGQFDKMSEIGQEMMVVAHNADEGAEAILTLGVAYYNLDDYASAVKYLSMGIDTYYSQTGNYFLISVWLSRSYEDNGETAKACEQYKFTVSLAQQKNATGSIDEYESGVQRNCP